jgi:spermidine synthase
MVGLALGAFVIGRMEKLDQPRKGVFLAVQGMVSLYPLLLLGALSLMAQSESSSASLFYAGAAFPGLAFLAGIVGGLQFPLANALWLVEKPGVARAAGYTYGIDLIGSCLGAFLTTALLIPLFGIPFTCITAAVITGGSLILLALGFALPACKQ